MPKRSSKNSQIKRVVLFYSKLSNPCNLLISNITNKKNVKLLCLDNPAIRNKLNILVPIVPALWIFYDDDTFEKFNSLSTILKILNHPHLQTCFNVGNINNIFMRVQYNAFAQIGRQGPTVQGSAEKQIPQQIPKQITPINSIVQHSYQKYNKTI